VNERCFSSSSSRHVCQPLSLPLQPVSRWLWLSPGRPQCIHCTSCIGGGRRVVPSWGSHSAGSPPVDSVSARLVPGVAANSRVHPWRTTRKDQAEELIHSAETTRAGTPLPLTRSHDTTLADASRPPPLLSLIPSFGLSFPTQKSQRQTLRSSILIPRLPTMIQS
jgi:hypothetical protein